MDARSAAVLVRDDSLPRSEVPARAAANAASQGLSVVVVSDADELAEHGGLLEDLAANAIEANVFYEPFFLLPMLRAFAGDADLSLALVFGPDPVQPTRPRVLHGFFPMQRRASFRGFPLKVAAMWGHDYISIRTPLVRRGSAAECLRVFFAWAASDLLDCDCVGLEDTSGDGAFSHHLTDYLNATRRTAWVASAHTRAMFRPARDADVYLRTALAGKHLKEMRRHERLLSEQGPLTYAALGARDDLQPWLDDFLRLEASGWKGREGSALGLERATRGFFEEMTAGAHERGRLMMLALASKGQPIAAKCSLLTADGGGYAFKIGFDEAYARFSPGVLLEIENIRRLHAMGAQWMDSCAIARHPMINRLWPDRRQVQTLLISTGRRRGDLALSFLPLLRLVKREVAARVRNKKPMNTNAPQGANDVAAPPPRASRISVEPLRIDPAEFAAKFNRTPFLIRHDLADHPLFALPRLIDLARRLPATEVEYNSGDLPVSVDPTQTPRTGLSVEETIRRIEDCRSWLVLKRVEQDPQYSALLDQCLDQVSGYSQALAPGMRRREAFIFVSSPGSVTPYHMDSEYNFLLQIRGKKTFHVFDGNDRALLSEQDLERYFTGGHRNLTFRDEFQAKAMSYEMEPGLALHVPVTFPHWLKNHDNVSISFSITFRSPESERREVIYQVNAGLRRLPLLPVPYGSAGWRDTLKFQAYRAYRLARRALPAAKTAQNPGRY